jgi:phage shock protein E
MKNHLLALSLLFAATSSPSFTAPIHAADASATKIQHADAKAAAKLIETNKELVILDIRTPSEFADGHIDKAVNVDFYDKAFGEKIGKLDKSKTYLVHCAAGGRSTKSLDQFKAKGFTNVVHLDGGFNAWKEAGQPVKK